jgi:hypothetical protein
MRIANANGTITIVTNINVADLKEPQKVYDKHHNEVYCIRKAAKGEAGGFNKFSAVLNGVVDGKAALIIVKSEDFDYDKFKADNANAMAMFYEAEAVIAQSLSVHKTRVERMWEELEGAPTCYGTVEPDCETVIPEVIEEDITAVPVDPEA